MLMPSTVTTITWLYNMLMPNNRLMQTITPYNIHAHNSYNNGLLLLFCNIAHAHNTLQQ